jgi:putative acetyltransferase
MEENMQIIDVKKRTPLLLQQLEVIWESSVRSTHLFLSETEILAIKVFIPEALKKIPHLVIIENSQQEILGFMGIDGQMLEMLFISADARGKGYGKALLHYGIETFSINELTVNEQNPLAKGFYEKLGFQVVKRTATDQQGKPYPILYMELKAEQD